MLPLTACLILIYHLSINSFQITKLTDLCLRDFRLQLRGKRKLRSSGLLLSVSW